METTKPMAGLDPERQAHWTQLAAERREAHSAQKLAEIDEAEGKRLAWIEKRKADYDAGRQGRLDLLQQFGELLVFDSEHALAQDFAWATYRRWVQAKVGPALPLTDARVIEDREKFDEHFAEQFKLEVIQSAYAEALETKPAVAIALPGSTSKRWSGVAVVKIRDRVSELERWNYLRRELGANAPATADEVNLGGVDLEAATEQASELIASKQPVPVLH